MPPRVGEPELAEPPFAALAKLLDHAREVRELGPGVVDGQPVTSFLATLEPTQLQRNQRPTRRRRRLRRPLLQQPPPTVTLEVALAQDGLPVRTVVAAHVTTLRKAEITTSTIIEIPAINFPLAIEAPPTDQTITVAQLRELERRSQTRATRHHRR